MSVCLDGLEAEREVALVKKVAAVGGDAAAAVAVWEAFVAHMAGLDLAGNKAESAEIAETGRELQMKHLGNSAFELLVLAGSGAAVSEKLVAAPAKARDPAHRLGGLGLGVRDADWNTGPTNTRQWEIQDAKYSFVMLSPIDSCTQFKHQGGVGFH